MAGAARASRRSLVSWRRGTVCGSTWEIAGRTSDPDTALRNLLERDRLFTERLRDEVKGLDLRLVEVDTSTTEGDLAGRVAEAFGLPSSREDPCS